MRMHVLEVSESTSSIAEHDLSDLVPSYSPAHLYRQHSDESSPNSNDSSYFPAVRSGSHFASPENVPLSRPPAAIVYAASTAAHSSSTNTSSTSQHPVSLIPTVSPPRYQLSLSHPGTPPSRNHARRTESYPPEARRAPPSPPLSQYSAPTILQQQEQRQNSIVAYDATWHDRSNATRAVSVPAVVSQSHVRPGLASLPEYEIDDEAQLDPVSEEQHARITKEQYRLGVGYDEHASGTTGKRISDQRRLERLKALEKEFGRVKMQSRSQSWNGPPTPTSKEEEDNRKASSKTSKSDPEKKVYPHKHEDDDDDAEDSSVKMTFKEMRVKEKEERARLNKELGITKDGNLLTQGRKTRLALRWTQGLLGFLAVICGLGGAFVSSSLGVKA